MNIREEMWVNCFLLKKKNGDKPRFKKGQTSFNCKKARLFSQNKVCPQLKNSALSLIKCFPTKKTRSVPLFYFFN